MKATWNGITLAESDETIVVEGNHYFPPPPSTDNTLRRALLIPRARGKDLPAIIRS